jgi:hypothetical protein
MLELTRNICVNTRLKIKRVNKLVNIIRIIFITRKATPDYFQSLFTKTIII